MHDISLRTENDNKGYSCLSYCPTVSKEEKVNNANARLTRAAIDRVMQDRYLTARHLLRCRVELDCDPKRAENMDHLRKAADLLKEMACITDYFTKVTKPPT